VAGYELRHAVPCRPHLHVHGLLGLPTAAVGGLGVAGQQLPAGQLAQPAHRQLGGLRQHRGLHRSDDDRIGALGGATELGGQRAGARPVEVSVGQRRPGGRQPLQQGLRLLDERARRGPGGAADQRELVGEELAHALRRR
jgi:hypothetical protein